MGFGTMMEILGLAHGAEGATNSSNSTGERVMDGVEAAGSGLTLGTGALTGASSVGGLGLGGIGTIIGEGGAWGAGMAGLASGAVLTAAATGYGIGTAADHLGGRALGALGSTRTANQRGLGPQHEERDNRPLSERLAFWASGGERR